MLVESPTPVASAVLMKATAAATGFGSRSRSSLECGVRVLRPLP
jgi:hypothetical protein